MVTLTGLRQEIVAVLSDAGLKATEFAIEGASPPLACVLPGTPYLSRDSGGGLVPGEWLISHFVLIVTEQGTNQRQYEQLDSMIETALVALDDFDVLEVSEPRKIDLSNGAYLGVVLEIESTERVGD